MAVVCALWFKQAAAFQLAERLRRSATRSLRSRKPTKRTHFYSTVRILTFQNNIQTCI